jgi:DNA-binding CsgD family transcriptional regulator
MRIEDESEGVILSRYAVLRDSTLSPNQYWLKIEVANRSKYDGAYNIRISPNIDNTVYYRNIDAGKWVAMRAGAAVESDKSRLKGLVPVMLRGQSSTTIWVKVDMGTFGRRAAKPLIQFEREITTTSREMTLIMMWIISSAILSLFIGVHLYAYFGSRDKISLYFVIGQLGALVYAMVSKNFLATLVFCPPFTVGFLPDGNTYAYTLNSLLMHLSVVAIIYGIVQLTRTYLVMGKTMPVLDKVLRYVLYIYMTFTVVVALINCFVFCLNVYSLPYENALIVMLVVAVVVSGIVAYRRSLPASGSFLLANIVPVVIVMFVAIKNIFASHFGNQLFWLPELGVICHAVGFSLAIAARVRVMEHELKIKEMETGQLALEIQEISLGRQLIELENEQILTDLNELAERQKSMEMENRRKSQDIEAEKNRNEVLQQKLEANQRELASSSLYIAQKNEMLATLKSQIRELNIAGAQLDQDGLQSIHSILQSNLYLDENWGKFKLHFEQVHPHFFEELRNKYPSLTRNETRLYAYIHMQLSAKEIAALLNIDPTSVHRAKTRLLKKMALTERKDNQQEA